ncbi:hypothetical protein HMPREF0971_01650 [Segatella oris F0302]|uniref:Uncharacterized protein n=1 Tax=Segatella oris F0302 TaxID=649760 RepID=D1QRP4_9BACT|nr:hypothetical protein HMPREF0971_01650 [Segatella oris F0302]
MSTISVDKSVEKLLITHGITLPLSTVCASVCLGCGYPQPYAIVLLHFSTLFKP